MRRDMFAFLSRFDHCQNHGIRNAPLLERLECIRVRIEIGRQSRLLKQRHFTSSPGLAISLNTADTSIAVSHISSRKNGGRNSVVRHAQDQLIESQSVSGGGKITLGEDHNEHLQARKHILV